MFLRRIATLVALISSVSSGISAEAVSTLDEQFELPPGFHIYKAASADLTGGSYAMTFDGQGRLLIGDGTAVRRLSADDTGAFTRSETIANNLGWRGPQGLLVFGDKLYAAGGDGVQMFDSYTSGTLIPRGRIGNKFSTGGDHDAHTLLRGFDNHIYLMAGNGAGIKDRDHITEARSPMLFEREASIFRFDPAGTHWECVAAGGRNPPNLGLNYLGDFFSFDSDMEWHVGLPWYRPVRLNHWIVGGDQGWQEVGAYPPYYIDALPGILNVGRGSPTWGTFYEHSQFPEKYRDAFIVCDYRWKVESNDQYTSSGRLVCFFLKRDGASWKAEMQTLAKPKPGATDATGKPISFALVDVKVAPDGSLVISDHNQGIWRLYYGSERPPIMPKIEDADTSNALLELPQPDSEWSRLRQETIASKIPDLVSNLTRTALDEKTTIKKRLRAIRLLGPYASELSGEFLSQLAKDRDAEIRAAMPLFVQFRSVPSDFEFLKKCSEDAAPLVRRRVAEALTGLSTIAAVPLALKYLHDPVRVIRYSAMTALAHYPTVQWFDLAMRHVEPETRMRALVAASIRRDLPSDDRIRAEVVKLISAGTFPTEEELDLLRIFGLFRKQLEAAETSRQSVAKHVLARIDSIDSDVRWEAIRLSGEYRISEGFPMLLQALLDEKDHVTQFHIAQALANLEAGWTAETELKSLNWFLVNQTGWFADFDHKGVEFPLFWGTTLDQLGRHHSELLLANASRVRLDGLLGNALFNLYGKQPDAAPKLIGIYKEATENSVRAKTILALKDVPSPMVASFLREEVRSSDGALRDELIQALAANELRADDVHFFSDALASQNPRTIRAASGALTRLRAPLDADLAISLVTLIGQRRDIFYAVEAALVALSGKSQPSFSLETDPDKRPDKPTQAAAVAFWRDWFSQTFKTEFKPRESNVVEHSDEQLHRLIVENLQTPGDRLRGRKIYERLLCNSCHGGGETPGQEGRLFGPDLAGVTQRLTPSELANAIVYPSKQVADRFKAMLVQLRDGEPLTGLITEQADDHIVLADQQQVHRLSRANIEKITPQDISLMPEHLLNRLNADEIRDLLSFLRGTSAAAKN